MSIGKNIRALRIRAKLSQDDLAKRFGYKSFTTIQKWESDVSSPPFKLFVEMAEMFGVNIDDFTRKDFTDPKVMASIDSLSSADMTRIPVYGTIPAGIPLEAVEEVDGYISIDSSNHTEGREHFALRIRGSSMYPKYNDGDIVLFEKRSDCGNGDICAVRIGGEDATFKKVCIEDDAIILQPLNPDFEPLRIVRNDGGSTDIEILGIAVELRRKL